MSEPKHLPPRDCLVLYQDESDRKAGDDPYWIQVNFQEADGEIVYDDITPRTVGHDDQWVCAYSREVIEVESVITWRELPEVE